MTIASDVLDTLQRHVADARSERTEKFLLKSRLEEMIKNEKFARLASMRARRSLVEIVNLCFTGASRRWNENKHKQTRH
jgi:hypothetical protein